MENREFKIQLEKRTKLFATSMIMFLKSFPFNHIDSVVSKQVLRSATSIGANYREANRAESRADFIHKIGIVEKEASETQYWLEVIEETWTMSSTEKEEFKKLADESSQLIALFTTISRNTKRT